MTNYKKPYKPTKEETDEIQHAAFAAAWQELQPLRDDDLPDKKKVFACLSAFKAAKAAEKDYISRLEAAHPKAGYIDHYLQLTAIVCSALMALDLDDSDELAPISILGARILPLLQAAIALESMSRLVSALNPDDGEIYGTDYADEVTSLGEGFV